jgi:hypothetical protein
MPEHANRFIGLYDQQNENRIADWGGDELFTRMPRRRAVDDAPAPRFRPSLVLVDTPAEPAPPTPAEAEHAVEPPALTVVGDAPADPLEDVAMTVRQWDGSFASEDPRWETLLAPPEDDRAPNGRRTRVITGHPDPALRPLSLVPAERRRPRRTPAEWIGGSPERIMAYAFVLGLILILVAISTTDA